MDIITTVASMRARLRAARQAGRRIALVPTMGGLHDGHLALVQRARRQADYVVVSIFVNPTQFGPEEDLERYPRDLEGDARRLEGVGADVAFAPPEGEMYPDGAERGRTWVEVEGLDAHLCGAHRPGHFRGVATVVSKLFNICRPHVAVFGQKDAQQLVIVRRMARDLHVGVEIEGVPTVREADGLALSSRNAYLSPRERGQAPVLSQAVGAARQAVEAGERRGAALVETVRRAIGRAPDAHVQYAEVVDAEALQPVGRIAAGQEVLAAVAVYFGETRLIDNAFVRAPAAP